MLKKYNELVEMLTKKYNVSSFCELEEEYSSYIYNNNFLASIYLEDEYLQIFIEEKFEKEYHTIENKKYKNVKCAYNFIKRFLED